MLYLILKALPSPPSTTSSLSKTPNVQHMQPVMMIGVLWLVGCALGRLQRGMLGPTVFDALGALDPALASAALKSLDDDVYTGILDVQLMRLCYRAAHSSGMEKGAVEAWRAGMSPWHVELSSLLALEADAHPTSHTAHALMVVFTDYNRYANAADGKAKGRPRSVVSITQDLQTPIAHPFIANQAFDKVTIQYTNSWARLGPSMHSVQLPPLKMYHNADLRAAVAIQDMILVLSRILPQGTIMARMQSAPMLAIQRNGGIAAVVQGTKPLHADALVDSESVLAFALLHVLLGIASPDTAMLVSQRDLLLTFTSFPSSFHHDVSSVFPAAFRSLLSPQKLEDELGPAFEDAFNALYDHAEYLSTALPVLAQELGAQVQKTLHRTIQSVLCHDEAPLDRAACFYLFHLRFESSFASFQEPVSLASLLLQPVLTMPPDLASTLPALAYACEPGQLMHVVALLQRLGDTHLLAKVMMSGQETHHPGMHLLHHIAVYLEGGPIDGMESHMQGFIEFVRSVDKEHLIRCVHPFPSHLSHYRIFDPSSVKLLTVKSGYLLQSTEDGILMKQSPPDAMDRSIYAMMDVLNTVWSPGKSEAVPRAVAPATLPLLPDWVLQQVHVHDESICSMASSSLFHEEAMQESIAGLVFSSVLFHLDLDCEHVLFDPRRRLVYTTASAPAPIQSYEPDILPPFLSSLAPNMDLAAFYTHPRMKRMHSLLLLRREAIATAFRALAPAYDPEPAFNALLLNPYSELVDRAMAK